MTDTRLDADAAQTLAEAVAEAMWSRDRAAQALGMRIDSVAPGRATLSMPVRSDMVNGHHICHGGLIFSLADTAFAYACNAYNLNTVASGCNIDFVAPGKEGDTLQATAVERPTPRGSNPITSYASRTGSLTAKLAESATRS